ncbi:unnamed protein product [Danaus chrysippus]|uniref:ETFB lysine methyltransferase n=1 Tax=Danaus chrysippus TaxID=151541 RepID=A0A8J2QT40_9NEOP|nr:unnamed protein product [Danaus chrysippus]
MQNFKALFLQHTSLTRNHLTPEILLRLVTPSCPLWRSKDSPFEDPFWAFYWPGGQATARYILDNPLIIKDRRVLDVGSGCGATAIAAALRGTKRVLANDIDPVAVMAIKMNAELNNVEVQTDTNNYIGTNCEEFDTILIGDMFYDEDFGNMLFTWLRELASKDKMILVGDPGRHGLTKKRLSQMTLLAQYKMSAENCEENNGFTHTSLWRINK